VKIGNVQEFIFSCPDPFFALVPLTGWTMPVPAAVITDVQFMATIAFINVPAHRFCPASSYGL
jgi:hypothetical protein